ncbi:hypothetical protein CDAR_558871 [Caerostris darwini]|uniref:Uncharacterized protein n=1 Tax=Caerostris darwini TaxID=1538125 RepID=A0AAV4V1X8_9ARAC|nr:hypothetical protein CDAR_558871 [Caerostris darwini]
MGRLNKSTPFPSREGRGQGGVKEIYFRMFAVFETVLARNTTRSRPLSEGDTHPSIYGDSWIIQGENLWEQLAQQLFDAQILLKYIYLAFNKQQHTKP